MRDIYEDFAYILGDDGFTTHMLPRLLDAVEPWLRGQIADLRFWNGEYDTTHVGEYPLRPMTREESDAARERYKAMPDPLAGKAVVMVQV
jgi:hypothetical protein